MFAFLCRVERSTDQVMKPVNTDALSKWVGHIPSDVISDMAEIAPMLARLGYDPHGNPPDYTRGELIASPFNYSQVRFNFYFLINFYIDFYKRRILHRYFMAFKLPSPNPNL